MHSGSLRLVSRVSKAARRRWIVRFIELCFYMVVMSVGCVLTALAISEVLKWLGVG